MAVEKNDKGVDVLDLLLELLHQLLHSLPVTIHSVSQACNKNENICLKFPWMWSLDSRQSLKRGWGWLISTGYFRSLGENHLFLQAEAPLSTWSVNYCHSLALTGPSEFSID